MKKKSSFIFILFFLICSLSYSQSFDTPERREILTLQDQRSLGENNKLLSYLNSTDPEIVAMTIYALANIGDTTTVHLIGDKLLNSEDEVIKVMSAFALGQIPSDASEKFLIDALNIILPERSGIIIQILSSLGKIGKEHSLAEILNYNSNAPEVNETVALSIGRFALRRIFNESSVRKLMELYNINSNIPVQRNIAYSLWRIGSKELLAPAENIIIQLVKSDDDQTRMWAVNALGKLQDRDHVPLLEQKFEVETEWRVKVNILNSLINYKTSNTLPDSIVIFQILRKASYDENPNVVMTALNLTGRLYSDVPLGENFKNNLKVFLSQNRFSWQEKSEALNSYAMIFKDESDELLLREYSATENYDLKSSIIRAFKNFNDGLIYKTIRDSISADVQRYNVLHPNTTGEMIGSEDLAKIYRAFVDLLTDLNKKVDDENRNIIRLIFSEFMNSKDIYITSVSVNALLDSIYIKNREETIMIIKFDYPQDYSDEDDLMREIFIYALGELKDSSSIDLLERELNSGDYDIAKSASDALKKITGKDYPFHAERYSDYDWNFLNQLNNKNKVTLITEKGNIMIKLYPELAPFTVMNFLRLINKNYFDGNIFHRVVPNFVIQDGDPTGTGYGGPGYSIRSEFSMLTYTTGTMGMASSGKDTEGSQFFITHSPQPHLDGRYTIFGQVLEGQNVVDNIIAGDRLIRIMIE
jgi:cyclophilin family peptidyl-prolyl cis-trans isomerase/HEAT repeat protein